jgi:glycosyltransferase involved in cell wall biosynthesis
MKPLRILYAMPGYKPAYRVGGPIASVSAAAEMLVNRGHEVTVITTNGNLDEDIDVPLGQPVDVEGVTVWYFKRQEPLQKYLGFVGYLSRSMGFLYAPGMRRKLDELMPRFDVVDTQMPFVYPTYAASRSALKHGTPLFYHQRGNLLSSHLRRRKLKKQVYIELFEQKAMKRATALIALSEAEREAFRRFAPETPCEVIPNGIHLPAPAPGFAERVQERWGVAPGAPVILFLGRLHPWKGPDLLLEAFVQVQQRHPDAVLILAGVDEDRVAERWGATQNVVFAGVVTGDVKSDLLHRANVFCLPSAGEGLSMAILEALAHRTAVLLSPGCNFEPGSAGLVVPRTADALAHGLAQLLGDRAYLERSADAGVALVEREFTWSAVTDRLIETYSRGVA